MSVFKGKKFEALKDKWYDKLKAEGFNDIESDENNLKEWDTSIFSRYDQNTIGAKEEYFRLAGQFLNSHKFEDAREKLIWELHAEGLSFNDIAKKLKSKRYKVCSRSSMHITVKKLTEEMLQQNGITTGKKRSNISTH